MRRPIVAALALLACGASVGVTPTRENVQNKRKPATHTVTVDATSFTPETLTIKAGDTVVWINKDFIPHTASSDAGASAAHSGVGGVEVVTFDSGTILAGESWRQTFKSKGKAPYKCLFHPTMKATLRIE
jgi:plastocyanin